MAPLGMRGVPVRHRFDAAYENIDLASLMDFMEVEGIRLAGRASGRNLLEWPSGRFAERRGEGEVRVDGPPGVDLMTRQIAAERIAEQAARGGAVAPFSNHLPREPVAIGGTLRYLFGPEWIDIAPSVDCHTRDLHRLRRTDRVRRAVAYSLLRRERRLAGE